MPDDKRLHGWWWLAASSGLALLGLVGVWLHMRPPPPPDWRAAVAQAEAAGDCARVFQISLTAAGVRVPGADEVWMTRFGRPLLAGKAPVCAAAWRDLLPAGAGDAQTGRFLADTRALALGFEETPVVRSGVGPWRAARAALGGREAITEPDGGIRLTPSFPDSILVFLRKTRKPFAIAFDIEPLTTGVRIAPVWVVAYSREQLLNQGVPICWNPFHPIFLAS